MVATTHEDLPEDFQPDIIVRKGFEGEVTVDRSILSKISNAVYSPLYM